MEVRLCLPPLQHPIPLADLAAAARHGLLYGWLMEEAWALPGLQLERTNNGQISGKEMNENMQAVSNLGKEMK